MLIYRPKYFNSNLLVIAYPTNANAKPNSKPTSPPNGALPAFNATGPTNQT
jgi:hypothetical protein